jgi:hypothetical protein
MKESKTKQLRDFIKSHEMRYFVTYSEYSNQAHIKKAFKVEINNAEYWVYFAYGDRPEIKDERILLKTMDEAKAKVQKLREKHQKEKKEYAEKKKAQLEEVTKFLTDFSWYDYKNWDTEEIKPKGQAIANAIKRVYENMPRRERDDEQTYIKLLERYIKTGTIYTQTLSFHKDHVVSVKYGEYGPVQIELINGTTIIPKSQAVTNLIKTIFGDKLDSWSYNDIKEPDGKYDKIENDD